MTYPSISVIVTTYNWPKALARVLAGLCLQNYPHMEVIVADDGSTDETAAVINTYRQVAQFKIIHCWQPDNGFQAAMCRNKAVAKANNDYIVFIDGDCVPHPHFVTRHAKLAQKGWFVAGNRVLLNKSFSATILNESIDIENWTPWQWAIAGLQRKCNRLAPKQYLPLGIARLISPKRWQGAKTCNLGIWKEDYIAINGFDEHFIGWGFEDSDLVIRLLRYGIKRKMGKFATEVFHLWHPENSRLQMEKNKARLQETLHSSQVQAKLGIGQYLK